MSFCKCWNVCNKVVLEHVNVAKRQIAYFREVPEAGYKELSPLMHEVFSIDLQKLNVANPESCRRFVEKYGFPGIGESHSLFLLSRNAHLLRQGYFEEMSASETERFCKGVLAEQDECDGFAGSFSSDASILFVSPSEIVRRRNWNTKAGGAGLRGGIMSVVEVQFRLRQLQNSFAILIAFDYFRGNMEALHSYIASDGSPLSRLVPGIEGRYPLFWSGSTGKGISAVTDERVEALVPVWDAPESVRRYEIREHLLKFLAEEVCDSILESQRFISSILGDVHLTRLAASKKGPRKELVDLLNCCGEQLEQSSLAKGLAIQFAAAISDERSWQKCSNPRCGRLFKMQDTFNPLDSTRARRSIYCSKSCSVAASKFGSIFPKSDFGA